MAEEPRALVRNLQNSVHLMRATALLRARQQIDGLQHLVERDMCAFKDRADLHCKLLAALVALVDAHAGRLTLEPGNPLSVGVAAMGASRAFRPQLTLQMVVGSSFVVDVFC